MSYTYPEALTALESIANDYIKAMKPHSPAVYLVTDIHAQTASVTWNIYSIRVTMPVRAASSRMTEAEFQDWTSYLLHELGHPTFTDQAVWKDAVKAGHSRMVNALEDVRMERAVIASGIVPNAKAVLSRLLGRKIAEARVNGWKPNARKEIAWTLCVLGRAANGYAFDASDLAWIKSQILPGSTVETVLSWALPELAACTSTADCLELAKRIAAAIAVPTPQGQDDGTNGQDRDSYSDDQDRDNYSTDDDESSSEGKGEGESEGDQGEGKNEKPTSEPQKPNEGPSNSEGGKGGKGHGDDATDDDDDETPVTSDDELTNRELAPEGDQVEGHPSDRQTEKAISDILRSDLMKSKPRDNSTVAPRRMTANALTMRDTAAKASRQRALLARALRANETDEREGGRRSGRLDKGALSRAMAGSETVFCRRDISEGFDTDVCVLLDASGSMGGENMRAALEIGLVITQAAASVGAACTTEIFNSSGYLRAGALATKRQPNPADFSTLLNGAAGGTPLSPHMARIALNQAARASHKRRVVFVITDGGCDYGPKTVKTMADYLGKVHGTVFAHVSIGTALQGSFKAEVCVPWGVPVAEVGLEHFVKVLQAL